MAEMELFQRYLDENKLWSFEGESGVRELEKLVKEIGGYDDIREFLADNPAACEACVEHVRENLQSMPEWRENLISLMSDGTDSIDGAIERDEDIDTNEPSDLSSEDEHLAEKLRRSVEG